MKIDTMQKLLKNHDVIVAVAHGPYPRTAGEDLLNYCYSHDIEIMQEVIQEAFPDYGESFRTVMESKNISYHNMFIAEEKIFAGYCEWLFSVLAHCEERCEISNYDIQHKRLFGYLAEVLLNVYIEKHELACMHARNVFVAEYHSLASPKQERSSYCTECLTHKLYKIGFGKLVEILYRKYRSETHKRYMQYLKWCDNK